MSGEDHPCRPLESEERTLRGQTEVSVRGRKGDARKAGQNDCKKLTFVS